MSRFNYSKNSTFDDSDISEADQNDIAKILQDTDDLDGGLFKNKQNNLSKTMPSNNSSSKPTSIMQRNKSFNFEDDPLDDLDAIIGKKQENNKNTSTKPPLSQTMPAPSKPKIGFIFDDLEQTEKPKSTMQTKTATETTTSKPKSLVDDLFGRTKEEKPSNNDFKLNEKYLKMSQESSVNQQQSKNDDDFSFGGYVPSAVSAPRSSGPKRNVSFNDDLFNTDIFSSRPKTSQAIDSSSNKENLLSKTMPAQAKSNEDWLGLGNDNNNKSNTQSNDKKPLNDIEFDFDALLKPKSNKSTPNSTMNQQEKQELDKSIDLDNSFNSNKRRLSYNENKLIFDKPPPVVNKQINTIKDSMNSSFADSIENMDTHTKPLTNTNSQQTTNNNIGFSLNNLPPLQFELFPPKQLTKETDSNVPSDGGEDGWLSSLINNKKTKKVNINNSIELDDRQNLLNKSLNTNNNNNNNTTNSLIDSTLFNDKHLNYTQDRSSSPSHNEPINLNNKINSLKTKNSNSTNQNLHNSRKFQHILVENVNYDMNEIQTLIQRIKQLEYENSDLHMQLQHSKDHYELQIQLVQESCEDRLKILKEDRETSLKHFKEEKEILQNHIDLIEKEKHELINVYKRKIEDKQKEFDIELDKMKQLHRDAVDNLKQDHEDVIKRVKQLKEAEISAAIAASSHTKTIESVINLIEDNTKNLDSISHKVQMGHMMNLNEHDIQLRNKEEQLKLQEERLTKQQKHYENEIRLLNETVQRLENHLAEQSKSVAEERWKVKQQEKKMEAFQEALINEQRIIMDKLARERNDIERSKDDILVEQKRLMQQVYEEKRKIAEERANLEASLNAYKDKQHKDSLSNINVEAEITVSTKRLNEEKLKIEQIKNELKEKEIELKQEKKILEEKKIELDTKMMKLEQISAVLNQKYNDAEELFKKSNKEKESNMKILEQVNSIKMSHDSRLNQIQQQLIVLQERETQINQEKVLIYKQQKELEMLKNTLKCNKCKEPVKDFNYFGLSTQSSGYGTGLFNYPIRYQSTLVAQMNNTELEDSKLMRQLKLQTLKDRQFINEEKQFIDSLKNSSMMTKSYSMNQLNSTLA